MYRFIIHLSYLLLGILLGVESLGNDQMLTNYTFVGL